MLQLQDMADGTADNQEKADEQEPVVSGPTKRVGQTEQADSEAEDSEAQMGHDDIL